MAPRDMMFFYLVCDGKLFVMGDNRVSFIGRRNYSARGIGKVEVLGVILLHVWPLGKISGMR